MSFIRFYECHSINHSRDKSTVLVKRYGGSYLPDLPIQLSLELCYFVRKYTTRICAINTCTHFIGYLKDKKGKS